MAAPVSTAPRPSITRRRLIVLLAVVSAAVAAFLSLGRILVHLDPLEHADAIYVLAGTRASRPIEAQRLFNEGFAPHIVLSPGDLEYAEKVLVRQGIRIPTDADRGRALLIQLGVPADAIIPIDTLVDNTAQEADAIKSIAEARGWRTLIVIGDRSMSRRTGYSFRRVFGSKLKVIVTANRDDAYDGGRWWTSRGSIRSTLYEAPKLLAYWLGLRG